MMPSSPIPPQARGLPGLLGGPPFGELGLFGQNRAISSDQGPDDLSSLFVTITATWYLATCYRCGRDLSQPFMDLVERDEWAVKHAEATGHVVHLSVDGEQVTGHRALLLRYFAHGAVWRWMCPAPDCERWNGPYDSGQLALAAWRAHGCRP